METKLKKKVKKVEVTVVKLPCGLLELIPLEET